MHINLNLYIPWSYIIITLLGIVVVADLALAWRTWVGNRKHPNNIFFALAVLMAAGWTLLLLASQQLTNSPVLISWFARLYYFFASWIVFFFYLFTYQFPYKTFQLSKNALSLLTGSAIFISIISLLPDVLIAEQVLIEDRFAPEISKFWHGVYGLYFLTFFFLSFRNLFLKHKGSYGILRQRLKQVIVANMVAFIGGMTFSLVVPFLYTSIVAWVGPLFSLFMFTYIWYHIFWKTNRRPKQDSYDPYPY